MEIFNHKDIDSEKFYAVKSKENIKKTPPNSVVIFDFDFELCRYAKEQNLRFAVKANDIKEVVFANSLRASYILVKKPLSQNAQKVTDNYMFDSKILLLSEDENDIEFCALNGIDGIFFK